MLRVKGKTFTSNMYHKMEILSTSGSNSTCFITATVSTLNGLSVLMLILSSYFYMKCCHMVLRLITAVNSGHESTLL